MIAWRQSKNKSKNKKINNAIRDKKSIFIIWRGDFAPLFVKKHIKSAFFLENILSVKKKAVPLHRFSADVI